MSLLSPVRSFYWRVLLTLLVACAVLAAELWQRPAPPAAAVAAPTAGMSAANAPQLQVVSKGDIPMPPGMAAAHASSLLPLPANHAAAMMVFWFSGDRESGPNVQIAASQYVRTTQQWSPARFVVNRFVMGKQLGHGLRRLGNPVVWMDGKGQINLFVVATGWGGWAASRVLHLRQSSEGNDLANLVFEPVRILPLSWLWNTSFLVRNAALQLEDGGMVLPVHFELGIKYPIALRFDAAGEYRGMVRISRRPYMLQPSLVAQAPTQWLSFMRDERPQGKIGVAQTTDGGKHWTDLPDLVLDNPDASVAAISAGSGQIFLAYNSSLASRGTLDLGGSNDGRHWSLVTTLEHGGFDDEFSYPSMVWADGSLWISYTVDRKRIAWQRLAPAVAPLRAQP